MFVTLVLHLLRIGPTSFALDHSLCSRMIWILTTFLILLRCQSPYYRFQKWSVRVLWANNGSPRSIVHQFIRFPLLRRPSFINIPFWVAWWVRIQRVLSLRTQRSLTFVSGFPGLSDAVEDSAAGVVSLHRATKFIIGFDFAVTLSSPEYYCVLFDITSEHSAELKWLMLNKHKRWFHSSRVKFPLVNMSASWFLVLMYLIRIFGVQIDSIE